MAEYELYITDDAGARLPDRFSRAIYDNFVTAEFGRVANGVGYFRMVFPASFDRELWLPYRMIQFWRKPTGGALSLWRPYFWTDYIPSRSGGKLQTAIGGPDVNHILGGRNVMGYAGGAVAEKSDLADDMMKEIVTQHLVTDAGVPATSAGSRDTPLTVQADLGAGPTLDKAFAFRNVLDVLQDLAEASRTEGTEVFFDITQTDVASDAITLQFQTKTGQPGQDISEQGVIFDESQGNMTNPSYSESWRNVVSYAYGGGLGEEDDRNIQQVSDATLYNVSVWGRREAFAPALYSGTESDNIGREAARTKMAENRPRRVFSAIPVDTAGSRFGVDWNYGDKVKARFLGYEFKCIVRAVTIRLHRGNDGVQETIDARLQWESLV